MIQKLDSRLIFIRSDKTVKKILRAKHRVPIGSHVSIELKYRVSPKMEYKNGDMLIELQIIHSQ